MIFKISELVEDCMHSAHKQKDKKNALQFRNFGDDKCNNASEEINRMIESIMPFVKMTSFHLSHHP